MRSAVAVIALIVASTVHAASLDAEGAWRLPSRIVVVAAVAAAALSAFALDRGRWPRPEPSTRALALGFLGASVLIGYAVVPFARAMLGGLPATLGGALLELLPLAVGLHLWGCGNAWRPSGARGRLLVLAAVLCLLFAVVEHGISSQLRHTGFASRLIASLGGWLGLGAALLMLGRAVRPVPTA